MNLPHLVWQWREGVPEALEETFVNQRMDRVSVDVLLPGHAALASVECSINDAGTVCKVKIELPTVFLNARHTAARIAHINLAAANVENPTARQMEGAITQAYTSNRYQGHRDAINQHMQRVGEEHRFISVDIPLPIVCNPEPTTRDDFGVPGRARSIAIGLYSSADATLQMQNQAVWMLHVELTGKERRKNTPSKPDEGYNDYTNVA